MSFLSIRMQQIRSAVTLARPGFLSRRRIAAATAGIAYFWGGIHWLINSSRQHVAIGPTDWNEHFRLFTLLVQRFYFRDLHATYQAQESWLRNLLFLSPQRPPAFYIAALGTKLSAGWIAPEVVLLTATFAMLVALWYVYQLAELLQPKSGLTALWLSLLVPLVWLTARLFNPTAMLVAAGMAFVYYALAYDRAPRLGVAIALGACAGVGMLTDMTGSALVLVLLARAIAAAARRHYVSGNSRNRSLAHMLAALAVAVGIIALFYHDRSSRAALALFIRDMVFGDNKNPWRVAAIPPGVSLWRALGIAGVAGFACAGFACWRRRNLRTALGLTLLLSAVMLAVLPATGDRSAVLTMAVLLGIVCLAMSVKNVYRRMPRHHAVITVCIALLILIHQGRVSPRPFGFGTLGFKQAVKQAAVSPGKAGYLSDAASQRQIAALEQFFVLWGRRPVLLRDIPSSPHDFYLMFHYFNWLIMVGAADIDAGWPEALLEKTGNAENWLVDMARDDAERNYVEAILTRIGSTRPQFALQGSYKVRPELLMEKPTVATRIWRRKSLPK